MTEPEDYARNVGVDLEALARDGDCLVSAVTGGISGQTVSTRVALADRRGERWACAFCAFLSQFVQPDHCRATLTDGPMPWWVYVRAGYCFAFLPALAWTAVVGSWLWAVALACGMVVNWLWGRWL